MLEAEHDALVRRYVDATCFCSVWHHARSQPGADELAERGWAVVPALLRALERGEGGMHVIGMLHEITSEWPDAPAHEPKGVGFVATNVSQAAGLWIAWGRVNGHLTPPQAS